MVTPLRADHRAVRLGRTLFPKSVVDAADAPRLLVSGANQRKLGDRVTVGRWKGMPIFALTLEERATCPTSCHHWSTCYGNGMPFSRRHRAGAALEARLIDEVAALSMRYPAGFVVRLHVLGDFYSTGYVALWAALLDTYPALHVFGYTAWPAGSEIGRAVADLAACRWDSFSVRRSTSAPAPGSAVTITDAGDIDARTTIVCPAQTGKLSCCGACGACWHPAARGKAIAFILHGMKRRGAVEAISPTVKAA